VDLFSKSFISCFILRILSLFFFADSRGVRLGFVFLWHQGGEVRRGGGREYDPVLSDRRLSSGSEEFAKKAISGGRLPCIIFVDFEPIVSEAC
jgi:hypothetical protein